MSMFAVVPAHDEAATIQGVVAGLRNQGFTVVVVDDASSDETGRMALAAGAFDVVRLGYCQGVGGATAVGLRTALLHGAEQLATVDGDGQHEPADAAACIKGLTGGVDIVVGARDFDIEGVPRTKRLSNLVAAAIFGPLAPSLRLQDCTCGLRAMTARGANVLLTAGDTGFGWIYESLIAADRSRITVKSVKVSTVYGREAENGTPVRELDDFLLLILRLAPECSTVGGVARYLLDRTRARAPIQLRIGHITVTGEFSAGAYRLEDGLSYPQEPASTLAELPWPEAWPS